jgi:predicted amidohydrolase YtcJ
VRHCIRSSLQDSILLTGRLLVFAGPERNEGTGRPKFEEALAIRDGRIVFVGASADARKYAGPGTSVIDLAGRMVMPGIVDGHFHGTRSSDCEMGYEGGTVAQVLAKLQACLDRPEQAIHKGTNVRFYATQFFGEAVVPEGTALTREDLDRLATRPIGLRNADGHKS